MIKQIGIGLYLIINCGFTQAQEKWISSAQIDFVFPNNATYSYDNSENHFFKEDFFYNGFLLRSFAIQADYNYLLFKKFSIGVLGGFQTQTKPSYVFLKFGGVLKYYFVNKNEIYVYMHAANNFTINNDKFRNGANARFGFAFPFLKKKEFAVV
ncbi:MAG: hypothetical protein COA50_00860 [Flavobacteriaceae bacterium]|nr:MAG: hypothetical protein COA50_00860 [Flavobacteriaceae bacterium]